MSDTFHLQRRGNAWHYIRRVPVSFAPLLGKKFVKVSFGAVTKAEAKKLRSIEDVKFDALIASLSGASAAQSIAQGAVPTVSEAMLIEHVRQHVAKTDKQNAEEFAKTPPVDPNDLIDRRKDAGIELAIVQNRDDPAHDQWIAHATDRALPSAGATISNEDAVKGIAEVVRRGLIEINRRRIDRLDDRHDKPFHDEMFNPARPVAVTFGELVDMFMTEKAADYAANGIREKSGDRIKGVTGYLRELIGDAAPVGSIDDDMIQNARAQIAATPTNRDKHFPKLPLAKQISKAAEEGTTTLAAATQALYLDTFRDILKVAVRKRLIGFNPAEDVKPLVKSKIAAADKRLPWTLDQVKAFFQDGKFYRSCAPDAPIPYSQPDRPWRFWLPLIMLFSGARPNEILQLEVGDIRQTKAGVWYFDLRDEHDEKQLKNEASRRRVPIHGELIRIGFLGFVNERKKAPKSTGPRLFFTSKADRYGSYSNAVGRSFNRTFLPQDVIIGERQALYSLRHNFRDALRRAKAPPEALAIAGWTVSKSASDYYGDAGSPDLLSEWVEKVDYPGLDLGFLHIKQES